MMKLWEKLKSAIISWSIVIPSADIGDLSAVFICTDVVYTVCFKLLSMFWYVQYLTREMAAPESMRAL